jgi:hypothetical protein
MYKKTSVKNQCNYKVTNSVTEYLTSITKDFGCVVLISGKDKTLLPTTVSTSCTKPKYKLWKIKNFTHYMQVFP